MVSDPLASSEAFIKAIKGVPDPPVESGLSKVELACEALARSSLYIPAKAEIITEWAISKMFKERMFQIESNPCLDDRFWRVVSCALNTTGPASTSKANHMWLNPLLLRYPLLPLMSTVMRHASSVTDRLFLECCAAVRAIAAHSTMKHSYDSSWELLLDTISAVIASPQGDVHGENNFWLGRLASQSFTLLAIEYCRSTLCEGNNKKKALAALIDGPIATWAVAQARVRRLIGSTEIGARLSETVASILFAPESLRQHLSSWTMLDESRRLILEPLFSESADISATLSILPHFFQSFVGAVLKHRSAIFTAQAAASSAERLPSKARAKRSCMAFFTACIKQIDGLPSQFLDAVWGCKRELVQIVEAESLIQSDDADAQATLAAQASGAVDMLAQVSPDSDVQRIESCLRLLASLTRLNQTLVEPSLPVLFPVLVKIPAGPFSHELLSAHLTYHIKTRTLRDVISLLCTAIASASPSNEDPRGTFIRSCVGDRSYTNELSVAISRYLTPSQVVPTVEIIVKAVQDSWSPFNEIVSVRPNVHLNPRTPRAKKRRISGGANAGTTTSGPAPHAMQAGARFASLLHVAVVALLSVPVHTASRDALSTIKDSMLTLRDKVILPAITMTLSLSEDTHVNEPSQLATAAALRLAYSLQSSALWRFDSPSTAEMENLGWRAELLLKADNTLPELRVEIVRAVLQHHSDDNSYPLLTPSPTFFSVLADLLKSHHGGDDDVKWDGSFATLNYSVNRRSAMILAIWELLLDRWLVVIDAYAPPVMLDVVVRTLIQFGTRVDVDDQECITLGSVCYRALNSAQFWEMPNVRPILLSSIEAKCRVLQAFDVNSVIRSSGKTALSDTSLDEAIQALHFVLRMPTEYLDKSRRVSIARAAISCDVLLLKAGRPRVQDHIIMRTLIFRIVQESGNVDLLAGNLVVVNLLSSSIAHDSDTPRELSNSFNEITLKLLLLVHTSASNTAMRGESSSLRSLLDQCENVQGNFGLKMRSTVQLLHTLATHADPAKIDVVDKCKAIFKTVRVSVEQALKKTSFGDGEAISEGLETLHAWEKLLKVKAWLGNQDNSQIPLSSLSLLKPLVSQGAGVRALRNFPDACLAVLGVVIQDSLSKADRTMEDVDAALGAVAVVGQLLTTDGEPAKSYWTRLESSVTRFSKTLSPEEFTHALESLYGAVSKEGAKNERLFLIFVSSIFIRNSPDGSYRINQEYTSRCLHTIPRLDLTTDSDLMNACFKVILGLVGDKSSSLRNADIASIYIMLGRAVAGSTDHDSSTRHINYETIVSILLALVRLRRDLVASSLSHFALVAGRLCEILRAVRPELAARQRRSVTDTLPFWINPAQPLPPECAKALARLLTNLNAKTIVRTGPSSHSDVSAAQAQSLAQPFSKHAPYVITTYIRALINPLSVMTPRIRQELEPGLFALCDMMGEHGRDTIMTAMLDDSGKIMMKLLWTEYEKQRYVGRG